MEFYERDPRQFPNHSLAGAWVPLLWSPAFPPFPSRHHENNSRKGAFLRKKHNQIEKKCYSGDRIPNRTELKKNFDASSLTVQRALDRLKQDGFITAKSGIGTFASPTLFAKTPVLEEENIARIALCAPEKNMGLPLLNTDKSNLYDKTFNYFKSKGRKRVAVICEMSIREKMIPMRRIGFHLEEILNGVIINLQEQKRTKRCENTKIQEITLGFAADWWFAAWLDGKQINSTLNSGNGSWPLSPKNHMCTVKVTKGKHLLVIKFVSGSKSSLLTCAGPDTIRKIK